MNTKEYRKYNYMIMLIITALFYSISNAQPCDDIYMEDTKQLTIDTSTVINKDLLVGKWKINIQESRIDDLYDTNVPDSLYIDIRGDSIIYVDDYARLDSSFLKQMIIGTWKIKNTTFRISGKLITQKSFGPAIIKNEEKGIEFCTDYSFSNGMICFYALRINKLYNNPITEVKCFTKISSY